MENTTKKHFKKQFIKQIKPMNLGIKTLLILLGIFLYSIALKCFVYPSNILPSGLTGLSYLCQKLINNNFGILIPITIFNIAFNAIPAICCFFIVGKAYTATSFIILFAFSFIADYIPSLTLTSDPMICAIFGGILGGYSHESIILFPFGNPTPCGRHGGRPSPPNGKWRIENGE